MKKVVLSAVAALCVASGAWAAPVTADRAKTTAVAFVKGMTGRNVTVKEVVASTDTYYIMNMSGGGWVIVSADDTSTPVLGYNTTGSLSWHSLPSNMQGLLGAYSEEIKAIKRTGVKAQHSEWQGVGMSHASRAEGVDPLIRVNWDQSGYFNKYCPGAGTNKAIVGCVAVAMSQAMSVQQYPLQPQGRKTYVCSGYGNITVNYDSEKAYNWEAILSGANSYDEVARLLYHAGVSVEMNYGTNASGIPSNRVDRIPTALAQHFGYKPGDLNYYWRQGYTGDWTRLVLNELNAGRAVVYNAIDTKNGYGHSFNVDGYDGQRMFHLNWGWGGQGNGFFTLDNLSDASMGMNYDSAHVVVVGIGSPDQVLKSIELSETVIDEKLPAGTVVGQITVNGEEPKRTFNMSVFGAYDDRTNTNKEIPFKLEGDLLVTTRELTASDEPIEVNIRAIDLGTGMRLTSSFNVTVCKLRTIGQATSLSYDRNSGDFLVKTRYGADYTLTGANGTIIAQGKLAPVPQMNFNMSSLSEGVNKLTLSIDGSTKTITIKK